MFPLADKKVVVIGGSRGVGRRIVEAGIRNGARVLAVARQEGPLRRLAQEVPGTEVLALDATDERAPVGTRPRTEPEYPAGGRRILSSVSQLTANSCQLCSYSGAAGASRSRSTSARRCCSGLWPRAPRSF
jgi:NAD(P)-dependent dehydrogenase (short-subunit alcohol dehydrogenase family)